MNVNQYLKNTAIGTRNEAQGLHKELIALFWISALVWLALTVLIQGLEESSIPDNAPLVVLLLPAILFQLSIFWYAYFITRVIRAIRLIRVADVNAVWTVLFAPLSWIIFYPRLVRPLKIIGGIQPIPEDLPAQVYTPHGDTVAESKYLRRTYLWTAGVPTLLFLLFAGGAFIEGLNEGYADYDQVSTLSRPERVAFNAAYELSQDMSYPERIDDTTLWMATSAEGPDIVYSYEVEVEEIGQLDRAILKEEILNYICNSADSEFFFDRGVGYRFEYITWPYGEEIAIGVDKNSCRYY